MTGTILTLTLTLTLNPNPLSSLAPGMWSPFPDFAAAGYDPEAARAECAPIAALPLKTDRDAAIAELDEGLNAAAHKLVGNMRGASLGNQEIHVLMVRALACLGLVLGLGWAHPNPNPNRLILTLTLTLTRSTRS